MHPNLSSHLHTGECNDLIQALSQCHKDHTFLKFVGWCNAVNSAMNRCLKAERIAKRDLNAKRAKETQEQVRINIKKLTEEEKKMNNNN